MRVLARVTGLAALVMLGIVAGAAIVAAIGLFAVAPARLEAAGPAEPWDLTLMMSDAYLTTLLNEGKSNQPLQLKDAQARFLDDGTVVIAGQASRGAGSGTTRPGPPVAPGATNGGIAVEIVLRPTVVNGALRTEVVTAQLGPLTLPARMADFLEAPLQEKLAGALAGKPYQILDLTVRSGVITVHARSQ